MRNQLDLGGGALPDIGVYPTVTTRFATGGEPVRVQASIERDARFGTDIYSSVRADFGGFELSFYLSTQLAARQSMVFHGDKGFVEVASPFNAGLYDDHVVTLHNQDHDGAQVFRFPGAQQYRLQVDAFVRAARGGADRIFTLEESILNQKVIDAIFRAGEHDGWEPV
jgi:predicted dehydrogenase